MAPNIKVTKFEDGKDVEFELSIELMPEIKIGDLSAIKLEKLMAEVPAEEVEKALDYIAKSRRETVKVEEDRETQKGDTVVIDFVGSIDGVEFKGGKGNNYPLELGSNSFIPGFEDQLIGKKAGDKVDVKVTFPDNYHAKDLAGKDSVFAVEIKELRANKPVEINDEFAKSLGEESLDKLKSSIAERIKGDYEAASKMKLKRQLLDNLDSEYKFEVPEGLVDAEYKSIVSQYEQAKKYNQLDESEKSKSEDELMAEYKDIAVRRVKLGLLLSEIGKDAKINTKVRLRMTSLYAYGQSKGYLVCGTDNADEWYIGYFTKVSSVIILTPVELEHAFLTASAKTAVPLTPNSFCLKSISFKLGKLTLSVHIV